MMYSQYLRIESSAGGLSTSNRAFIKACYKVLNNEAKTRSKRAARHTWLREGLAYRSTPFVVKRNGYQGAREL